MSVVEGIRGPHGYPVSRSNPIRYTTGLDLVSWSSAPPSDLDWSRLGESAQPSTGVHCFVSDWRLEVLWRGSSRGLPGAGGWLVEPDFSMLSGMPGPVVGWQRYRSAYLGAVWRESGYSVVPVLGWADRSTDQAAWAGIAPGSWLAVRAPSRESQVIDAWRAGFWRALEALNPSGLLVFGIWSRVYGALSGSGLPWRGVSLRGSRSVNVARFASDIKHDRSQADRIADT